jgi:glyceraldehyde-3-phosphate dehydrogenase (NADP+)
MVNSNFGQQVSIFASNPDNIAGLIDPLVNQVCRVNINSQCQRGPDSFPFTGKKDSAEGTLSIVDALKEFSIRTLVAAKESDLNKMIITDILKNRKSNFLSTDFLF